MTEKAFVKQLESIFINTNFITKKEVKAGYGVADLVLVKLNHKNCIIRRKNNQFKKLVKEEYFRVLDCIPEKGRGKPVGVDILVKKTGISKSFLKYRILEYLKKNKYIREENKNFYFKINGWIPIAKEIIAIEAKLKNWRRGFIQANRYKSFANKVYLAVPIEISHLVDKNLLKRFNIGLIVLDVRKNYKKISRVKKEKPFNIYKYNLAAEFVLDKPILTKI